MPDKVREREAASAETLLLRRLLLAAQLEAASELGITRHWVARGQASVLILRAAQQLGQLLQYSPKWAALAYIPRYRSFLLTDNGV